MTAVNDATPAIKMFGKMLTFSRIFLQTNDLDDIENSLQSMLSNKNSQIPVIIESDIEQNLPELVELFWSWGLQPIGVVTGILDDDAKAMRLAIFPGDGKRIERIRPTKKITQNDQTSQTQSESQDTSTKQPKNLEPDNTDNIATEVVDLSHCDELVSMIYDQMLRSGQSINHVGGDLILTNSVNSGAEVITDNNLHIYGRASGRLVAGATGDKDARIFCQRFNPSLVSVAGTYCLRDSIPEEMLDKSVQVKYVEGQGLVFQIMNDA